MKNYENVKHESKSRILLELIDMYIKSPAEQKSVMVAKGKSELQIEKRFQRSEINRRYIFPRTNIGDELIDSINSENRLLRCKSGLLFRQDRLTTNKNIDDKILHSVSNEGKMNKNNAENLKKLPLENLEHAQQRQTLNQNKLEKDRAMCKVNQSNSRHLINELKKAQIIIKNSQIKSTRGDVSNSPELKLSTHNTQTRTVQSPVNQKAQGKDFLKKMYINSMSQKQVMNKQKDLKEWELIKQSDLYSKHNNKYFFQENVETLFQQTIQNEHQTIKKSQMVPLKYRQSEEKIQQKDQKYISLQLQGSNSVSPQAKMNSPTCTSRSTHKAKSQAQYFSVTNLRDQTQGVQGQGQQRNVLAKSKSTIDNVVTNLNQNNRNEYIRNMQKHSNQRDQQQQYYKSLEMRDKFSPTSQTQGQTNNSMFSQVKANQIIKYKESLHETKRLDQIIIGKQPATLSLLLKQIAWYK